MPKPESVLVNEMQTDYRIPDRRPDLVIINYKKKKKKKRTCHPGRPQFKNQRKTKSETNSWTFSKNKESCGM